MARTLASLLFFGVNAALFCILLVLFIVHPTVFVAPWDGPAIATVALSAATVVLAAVAGGIGLLAVWGYTTLREHATNVARTVAAKAASEAADRNVQELLRQWGLSEEENAEAVAKSYEQE